MSSKGLNLRQRLILLGLFSDIGQDSAIDIEDMSVDEIGSIRGKEDGRALKVFGCSPSASRCLGTDEAIKRMHGTIRLLLAERSGLWSGDVARSDAVALNVGLAIFGTDVLGEHLQSALGGSIGRDSLSSEFGHHGADVDDLSMSFLDHIRDDGLGNDEGCDQVDINDSSEVRGRHLRHRNSLDDAGIVDKDIKMSEGLDDVFDHVPDLILLGDVTDISFGLNAKLLIGIETHLNLLLIAVVEDDRGTHLSICGCDGKSDAIAGSGDQGDFTI